LLTRQEAEAELCRQLDDEALRMLILAIKSIFDSPDGYGEFKVRVVNRRFSTIDVTNFLKAKRDC